MNRRQASGAGWRDAVVLAGVVAASALATVLATAPGAVRDAGRPEVGRAPVGAGGVAAGAAAAPAPVLPAAAPRVTPADARAGREVRQPADVWMPGAVDAESREAERRRAQVAARLDRAAAAASSLDTGALDPRDEGATALDARPTPLAATVATAVGGSELQGWDGGPFWFGPSGLVRVFKEAR